MTFSDKMQNFFKESSSSALSFDTVFYYVYKCRNIFFVKKNFAIFVQAFNFSSDKHI